MDSYNYDAKCEREDAQFPWWRNRLDGIWSLLFLITTGVLSFATIVLFNGALPAIPGK